LLEFYTSTFNLTHGRHHSLLRRTVARIAAGWRINHHIPELARSLGSHLLETRQISVVTFSVFRQWLHGFRRQRSAGEVGRFTSRDLSLSLSLIYLKLGEFQRWPSAYPTVAPWIPTAALARVVGLFTGWFTRVRRK
jgi:hypothetical protein